MTLNLKGTLRKVLLYDRYPFGQFLLFAYENKEIGQESRPFRVFPLQWQTNLNFSAHHNFSKQN